MKKWLIGALALTAISANAAIKEGQNYGDWKGICEQNQCAVMQVAKQNGTAAAGIVLSKVPELPNVIAMDLTVPLGVNLRNGFRLSVDGKQLIEYGFLFCLPDGCHASIPLEGANLEAIKRGAKLNVAISVGIGEREERMNLGFSLKGVTNALNNL